MNKPEIEKNVHDVHARIWRCHNMPSNPKTSELIQMLDPAIAAQVLGVEFAYYEELGPFGDRRWRFEVAGLVDRQAGRIAVSKKFKPQTMRFTGAHEIGHWILHPREVMHRDRPIDGLRRETHCRPPEEREADYFAACFLMPQKLVRQTLESTFGVKTPFVFDDDSAFWLCPDDPDSLLRAEQGSLDRAIALAGAVSYGGRHFNSLAEQFRVSLSTMAIRLKELGLIDD